jgi:hypothetical protein
MGVPRSAVSVEDFADSAGRALACMFSSSDEYEAALIAERRAEGRYGRHGRKLALVYGIGAAVLAVIFFLI